MRPFVTIVVPIYNVEQYLERCISSLINQTLSNIEIILVDDQSPDNCPALCDTFALSDSRIKVIHKENGGLGFARNSGIDAASGEYIAFVDSDDYIDLKMMEVLYTKAIEIDADAVISGGFIFEYANGTIYTQRDVESEYSYTSEVYDVALKMMGAPPAYRNDYYYEMSACKGIYSLSLIKEKNIRFHSERELISEDLKYHFDFCRVANNVLLLPECYYHYCENKESLTNTYSPLRFIRNVAFYKYMIDDIKDESYAAQGKSYADRMLLARARVAVGQIEKHYSGRYTTQAKNAVIEIHNNDVLQEIIASYPIYKLPFKQRVFAFFLKIRFSFGLYELAHLNNIKRR